MPRRIVYTLLHTYLRNRIQKKTEFYTKRSGSALLVLKNDVFNELNGHVKRPFRIGKSINLTI